MFIPTQEAHSYNSSARKSATQICLLRWKQEKLDEKTGKMKEENNNQSERRNLWCVHLDAVQSDSNEPDLIGIIHLG